MFRKLSPLIVCVCLLAACGGGRDPAETTSTTTRPTDASRAALLPLRTTDLPAGFAAVDVRSAGAAVMVNQCIPALFTANAAQIGETFVRDNDTVASQSYVLANAATASGVITAITNSDARTCLSNLLQTSFDTARAAHNVQDVPSEQTAGGLDPATAQYRVVAVRKDATSTQTVATADLLLCQTGSTITAVWLTWIGGSPDEATESGIVTALRARASAAFSA